MGVVDELVQGREAFDQRAWGVAVERLSAVDRRRLDQDDLLRLGLAAYLSGDEDSCVQDLQDAYRVALDGGKTLEAVRIAFWLGLVLLTGGEFAVGGGWVARAHRLLQDEPDDVVERGYLLIHEMHRHIGQGDFSAALEIAPQIAHYGREFGDANLVAMGLSGQGRLLMYAGQVPEALALLDEAMIGVTTTDVTPVVAGLVYCTVIEGCQEISDYARVDQWTRALTQWCQSQPDLVPFTAQCSVHRAQVMRAHGDYAGALDELDRAYQRYARSGQPPAAGLALAERGDVLRMTGRFAEAESAYTHASSYGHDPQPGPALLWLAVGRSGAALAAVRRLLVEKTNPVDRSRVLPSAVEVLIATGELELARSAAAELTAIAEGFGCAALRAKAAYATGSIQHADGDGVGALLELRRAWQLWTALDAPYEAARARVIIGVVLREMDDEDSAIAELTAARRTFVALGAQPSLQELKRLLPGELPAGLTAREVEVLRLVAIGKSNPAIAAELVLSEKTVARHLSNIFGKIDVSSRTAAAAYAFEHRLV